MKIRKQFILILMSLLFCPIFVYCSVEKDKKSKVIIHKFLPPNKESGLQYRFPDTVESEIIRYFKKDIGFTSLKYIEINIENSYIELWLHSIINPNYDTSSSLIKVLTVTNRYFIMDKIHIPIFFDLDRMYSIQMPLIMDERSICIKYKWANQYDHPILEKY